MSENNFIIPADVPDDMVNTYVENMNAATCGTGRMNLFACDQKIEHLNADFFDGGDKIPLSSNNPLHLFEIGSISHKQGKLGVLAGQFGLISRYARNFPEIPYLVKMNSKTNLVKASQGDPTSLAMWDVDDVFTLINNGINVVGIGYTIYLGSENEAEMLTEAATLIKQAHENGLITVTWIYPRGKAVEDEKSNDVIAGAAGVACCIGADFTKVNYPRGGAEALGIAVEAAGTTGIICSGGGSLPAREFLQRLWDQVNVSGARGAATGRNIHQKPTDDAVRMVDACHAIICDNATVDEAMNIFESS